MTNETKSAVIHTPEDAVLYLLNWMGETPTREGLKETPARVVRAYKEYFKGYNTDPAKYLSKHFEETAGYSEPVLLRDIHFYSHCEHHMAPIHGVVNIAYIPDKKVVGISKLARVVDAFARRLQIQEKMTAEIANCIQDTLLPKGVAVHIEAVHHCMMGRGVNLQNAVLVTHHFTGLYETDQSYKSDFKKMLTQRSL